MNPESRELGDALSFLTPGVVHQLGNALFRVQGHAQLLPGHDPETQRERQAILEAVGCAGQAVQLFHWLLGDGSHQPAQAGILLHRAAECLRVPLRERGLRLESLHSSRETPVAVDGALFLRGVLAAMIAMAANAVEGCGGVVRLDLLNQDAERAVVRIDLLPEPALLPFPVDAAACAVRLNRLLGATGVVAQALPGGAALVLIFPQQQPAHGVDGSLPGASWNLDPSR